MVQGYLTCLAIGFLFTFIPRRTGAAAPGPIEMVGAMGLPIAVVLFAWQERWMASQVAWISVIVLVAVFVARRIATAPTRVRETLPASAIWIPISLSAGVLGSVLTAVGASRGDSGMWLHDIGRGLVLQGMMAGLVCAIAPFLVPVITRGKPPGRPTRSDVALQLALALVFFGSFFVESLRIGLSMRAIATGAALVLGRVYLPPTIPGLNRRIVWLSAHCLPAGFALAAIFPGLRVASLHVTFLGGFALLGFAVSTHVFLSHGGILRERKVVLGTLMACAVTAASARFLMDLDRAHYFAWMAVASAAFLSATVAWGAVVMPALVAFGSRASAGSVTVSFPRVTDS